MSGVFGRLRERSSHRNGEHFSLCAPFAGRGGSQRLVVVAVAVALWRGDVAILVIVVLGPRGRRLLLRFIVALLARRFLFSGSTHLVSSDRIDRRRLTRIDRNLIVLAAYILAPLEPDFLPFSRHLA